MSRVIENFAMNTGIRLHVHVTSLLNDHEPLSCIVGLNLQFFHSNDVYVNVKAIAAKNKHNLLIGQLTSDMLKIISETLPIQSINDMSDNINDRKMAFMGMVTL